MPSDAQPGALADFALPDGRTLTLLVPTWARPGAVIEVKVPKLRPKSGFELRGEALNLAFAVASESKVATLRALACVDAAAEVAEANSQAAADAAAAKAAKAADEAQKAADEAMALFAALEAKQREHEPFEPPHEQEPDDEPWSYSVKEAASGPQAWLRAAVERVSEITAGATRALDSRKKPLGRSPPVAKRPL